MQIPNPFSHPPAGSGSIVLHPSLHPPKVSFAKLLRKNMSFLIMLLPAVIFVIIFAYLPMGGVLLAFKQYRYADGIFGSPWNGVENFKFFFLAGKIGRASCRGRV